MISQTVKKCTHCSREFPINAVFCPYDGSSLSGLFATELATVAPEPDEPDPFIGRVIERRYEIVEAIGYGGMGAVYRAVHTELNRSFAIKVIRSELGQDPVAIRRFRREALALGAISHPNAVTITDFGITSDGLAFLIMEYLEGVSLRQLITEEAPLSLTRSATIFKQICSAVTSAHRSGVIHRDLKPENIMLIDTEGGQSAKVLDFGIARLKSVDVLTGRLTSREIIIGTPRYMSPEAAQGLDHTPASDVYSLGVILYEMLAGRAPFECAPEDPQFVLAMRHLSDEPPPPSAFNPDIIPAIDAVVMHALAKEPDDRPNPALELAKEFEAAVATLHESSPLTRSLPPVVRTGTDRASVPEALVEAPTFIASPTMITPPPPAPSTFPVKIVVGFVVFALVVILTAAAIIGWDMGWFGSRAAPTAPLAQPPATSQVPNGMVLVPAGEFTMGEPESAGPRQDREPPNWPPHSVRVEAFYIDAREVTNGEYERFVAATGAPQPATWADSRRPANWALIPVTGVSWSDAAAYAAWAGKRLPSEDEWEYAARGTDGRVYPWGPTWDESRTAVGTSLSEWPEPVGSRVDGSSPFGALDLAGSAAEWTATSYAAYPGGTAIPLGSGDLKMVRGGSYVSEDSWAQRSTLRSVQDPTKRDKRIGFRCARSVAP